MSGLISVHRISADSPYPEIKEYTLTLKFPLQSYEELDCAELAQMLRYALRDTQDGRRCFNAEMTMTGLAKCLRQAVYHTVEKVAQEEFGREMVTSHQGRQRTSKWYLEAAKRMEKLRKPWINDAPEVEIT